MVPRSGHQEKSLVVAEDTLGLPPLAGGHAAPEPLAEPVPSRVLELFRSSASDEQSAQPAQPHRRGPSVRKRPRTPSPPRKTDTWDEARKWVKSTFDHHHSLLRPVLDNYLLRAAADGSQRCKTMDGFFRAFWAKENQRPARALATAVHFLLMENWRTRFAAVCPDQVPADRRAARVLIDPHLQEAAAQATSGTDHHRESIEFARSVVRIVADKFERMRHAQADEECDAGCAGAVTRSTGAGTIGT